MNLDQLTELFEWMMIVSIGILLVNAVLIILLKNTMIKFHEKLFGIKGENIPLMTYGYLGMLKLFITIFILVPYLSLLLMN